MRTFYQIRRVTNGKELWLRRPMTEGARHSWGQKGGSRFHDKEVAKAWADKLGGELITVAP